MEEEESWKKEGRIRKNGERRIIRVGNRVHNKQVVEMGAGVEGGKKRADMEEKLGGEAKDATDHPMMKEIRRRIIEGIFELDSLGLFG